MEKTTGRLIFSFLTGKSKACQNFNRCRRITILKNRVMILMASPLEKARKNPGSKKARILEAARELFGQFGFQGTTTRMIAKKVGIDISTLYYHWGEKGDLYEAVVIDIDEEIEARFRQIEKKAKGKKISERLVIAIDIMCDYLHAHPEVSNLLLMGYFTKAQTRINLDEKVAGHIANIAIAMGLASDRQHISPQAKARVMAVWSTVLNFISGENFFRPIMAVDDKTYLEVVKETLAFILIPAFSNMPNDP